MQLKYLFCEREHYYIPCSLTVLFFLFNYLLNTTFARHWIPGRNDVIHHVPSDSRHHSKLAMRNIRFHVTYDKTIAHLNDDKMNLIARKLIPEALNYFHKLLKVRVTANIKLQHRCHKHSYFLKDSDGKQNGNVMYCKKRCISTYCGPVLIPVQHLDQCRVCNDQGTSCRNTSDIRRGITNRDFVFYVSASQSSHCQATGAVAYASYCQQEHALDRPIAGFVNVCPNELTVASRHYPSLLATIKHEIFHALGFSAGLYAFYRDRFGRPLTPRGDFGLPPYNNNTNLYQWSSRVVKRVGRRNWETVGGRITHNVQLLVTPRVRQEVRNHFHCWSLQGAELENQGPIGTRWTHWEKRIFENEAMTGTYTQNPVFSRITLALMEDTGWYRVNYRMAEDLDWGRRLGCVFATMSCRSWMKDKLRKNEPPLPYCFQMKQNHIQTRCTHSRDAVAVCNIKKYAKPLPGRYQYFNHLAANQSTKSVELARNPRMYGGSVDLADFCPFYQMFSITKSSHETRDTSCHIRDNEPGKHENFALERYGESSRCIEQEKQWTAKSGLVTRTMLDWGSGCYETACTENGLTIVVGDHQYPCPAPGHVIQIDGKLDRWHVKGTLKCPLCRDLCEICPEKNSSNFENLMIGLELQSSSRGYQVRSTSITVVLIVLYTAGFGSCG